MEAEIMTWTVAVLIVSVPYALLFAAFSRHDEQVMEAFSTKEDLLNHVKNPFTSVGACWLLVVLLGGTYVGSVALVAYLLRGLSNGI
jgi:hypothetical protein